MSELATTNSAIATLCSPPPALPIAAATAERRDPFAWLLNATISVGLVSLLYLAWNGHMGGVWFAASEAPAWARGLERPSAILMSMGCLLLAFRTVLWWRYRPFASATWEQCPTMTVIIPAFNEGAMVARTIDSVAAAAYPGARLQVIVVDDGSTDDTWQHIRRAAADYPGLVETVRFARNQGKRAALETGFERARGTVVVTVDSDSVIERETLLAIAGPFRDPKVGAVAGKVRVFNDEAGVIPRMLRVRYILSFDFIRAVQSTYSTVLCCPGALAAYRASALREVLKEWSSQTFLGAPCTYGEDRALTNSLLARGYDAVYQRTAVVQTVVPSNYSQLCKMFLRWDRSYVREELRFAAIVWKRPLGKMLLALVDTWLTNLRFPVGYACWLLLLVLSLHHPLVLVRTLLAIGLVASLNTFYYLKSERSWIFVFGILYSYFSFFGLSWILPYAAVTVRSRGWLTR